MTELKILIGWANYFLRKILRSYFINQDIRFNSQ